MFNAIFCRLRPETRKRPHCIKVFSDGKPEYYVYQHKLSTWENFALACQSFCKNNNLEGSYFGALEKDGMVFIKPHELFSVDETTNFNEDEATNFNEGEQA